MSNLTIITDLLGHAYLLDNASPDEQHLKVGELIAKLVERDKVLVDALQNIKNYRTDMSTEIAERSMRFYAEMALEDVGEDV